MASIRFLNRDNRCIMEGTCLETGKQLYRDSNKYPCFRKAFTFVSSRVGRTFDITYTLIMHKELTDSRNNFVVLSKKDMMRLLTSMQQSIPFKYHFTEDQEDYRLKMTLVGTALQHKGLLMLSRMLFEFPHNICAADALKIKQEGHLGTTNLKNISIVNLYTLCLSSVPEYSIDESIIGSRLPAMMPTKEFKHALQNRSTGRKISNVIPRRNYDGTHFDSWGYDLDGALSENYFNQRKEVYSKNLKRNLNA